MPTSPDDQFFILSTQVPAPYTNGWRIVRLDDHLVKITLFEISSDSMPTDGEGKVREIVNIPSPRGAFILSRAGLEQLVEFAQMSIRAWKELDRGAPSAPMRN